jgi:hypothetical protein
MARHSPADKELVYRKRSEAAKLKREGHGWEEIAQLVGYADRAGAFNAVKKLMLEQRDLAYGEADLYRAESLDRLESLLKVQMVKAMAGDDKATTQCRLIISQIGDLRGEKSAIKVEWGDSDVDRLLREAQEEFSQRVADLDRQAGRVQAPQGADS